MKAILLGATGATGKELLQLLLTDPTVESVVALVRRPMDFEHEKLQSEIVNFDEPEHWKDLVKGDVAFSCLGTTLKDAGSKDAQYVVDFDYQLAFAKAAKHNHVPALVLVSAGIADANSLIFYSKMKGELEIAIRDLRFDSLTIFRPGLLLRPNSTRLGERWSVSVLHAFNKIGLLKNMAPLPVQDLARLMLRYGKQCKRGVRVIESASILSEAIASRGE